MSRDSIDGPVQRTRNATVEGSNPSRGTTPLQTSPVSIPSMGLALKAWKLAQIRVFPGGSYALVMPVRREQVDGITPASAEYYHILRRIEDGEAP